MSSISPKQFLTEWFTCIGDNLLLKCSDRIKSPIQIIVPSTQFKTMSYLELTELTMLIRNLIQNIPRLGVQTVGIILIRWCEDLLIYYGYEEYDSSFRVCIDDRFGSDNIRFTKDMYHLVKNCILHVSLLK
jgi:hypothetical protein